MSNEENAKNLITINSLCSLLYFSGNESLNFLNNLLLSDLTQLDINTYHFSALCNAKGRVVASFWIKIHKNKDISMICANNMISQLKQFFTMRRFRLKISIEEKTTGLFIDDYNHCVFDSNKESNAKDATCQQFYHYMFVEDLAWIDAENTEKFIPQHINYDQINNTMSFTKGCYPGQEIIARIKYLGTIKKRMFLEHATNEESLRKKLENFDVLSPIIRHNNLSYAQVVKRI